MSRASIAWHESGHYVCARELGFEDVCCEIDGGNDGGGVTRYSPVGYASHDTRKVLAVLLAGALAEQMAEGFPGLAASDFRRAGALLETVARWERPRVRREAGEMAVAALKGNWDLVEGLARHLRTKGSFP